MVEEQRVEEVIKSFTPFWTEQGKRSMSDLLKLSMLTPPAREYLMRETGELDPIIDYGHTAEVLGALEIPITAKGFMERFRNPATIAQVERGYLLEAVNKALELKGVGQLTEDETDKLNLWISTFETTYNDSSVIPL